MCSSSIVSFRLPLSNIAVTKHSSVSKFIARSIIILHPPSYVLWIFLLLYFPAPVLLPLPETLSTTAVQIFSVLLSLYKNEAVIANTIHNTKWCSFFLDVSVIYFYAVVSDRKGNIMLQKLYVFFRKETVLSIAVILALLSMFWVRPQCGQPSVNLGAY